MSVCDLIYLPTYAADCKIRYDDRLQIIIIFFIDLGATVFWSIKHQKTANTAHYDILKHEEILLNMKIKEGNTHIWEANKMTECLPVTFCCLTNRWCSGKKMAGCV